MNNVQQSKKSHMYIYVTKPSSGRRNYDSMKQRENCEGVFFVFVFYGAIKSAEEGGGGGWIGKQNIKHQTQTAVHFLFPTHNQHWFLSTTTTILVM